MPLLKSPQPETEKAKTEEQGELSAAEDFSDIGESDEEILNQDNDEEMPEVETEEANNEHETVISSQVVVFKLSCIYIIHTYAHWQKSVGSWANAPLILPDQLTPSQPEGCKLCHPP